jgi:hypothetical protein
MKYEDAFRRMTEDLQRLTSPFKDYKRLYASAIDDIARLSADSERLLHSLVPNIEQRYQGLAELARGEVERYKDAVLTTKHMTEIVNATSIVSHLVEDRESITRMAQEAIGASKYWQTQLDIYKSFSSEAEARRLALMRHYSDVTELSLIAQEHLRQLDWEAIRLATGTGHMISTTASSFSKLLENYEHLFQSFEKTEYKMASFPPFVSILPPVEIITGSDFLATISRRERSPSPQQIEESQTHVAQDVEGSLEDLLDRLNPELVPLWQGAKTALKSHNPDRHRHIVVSLRELVTHVLHQTAPDDRIHSWTADPSFFDKGRPTRQARLHYICRDLNHEPFEQFVARDISAHLELIRILQRGTHDLSIRLTDEQLNALVIRTESLIRFILVIWDSGN